jgi:hypothetical protein
VSSLKRSLDRAIEKARKTRVHRQVLTKLGRPMSEDLFEARKKANESGTQEAFWRDMDDFIDLEITEIELADRIVACLQKPSPRPNRLLHANTSDGDSCHSGCGRNELGSGTLSGRPKCVWTDFIEPY